MTQSGHEPLASFWAAWRPIPGQVHSGDQYLVKSFPGGLLAAVVDGLGHGEAAHVAARTAIDTLGAHAQDSVSILMQRCHEALRRTRGAVITLASFNEQVQSVTWLGVGNVEGMLIRPSLPECRPERVVPRGGIVGDRLPPLTPGTHAVSCGDILLLATDGIRGSFTAEIGRLEQARDLVNHIFARHAKHTDDALILGVQWTNGSKAATNGRP